MTPREYHLLIGSPRYVLGLDVGQQVDFTALVALEVHGDDDKAVYQCRAIKRWDLGTAYPLIVSDMARMMRLVPFSNGRPRIALDTTGVGRGIYDMLKEAKINASVVAITSTGGNVVTPGPGGYNVPKRDLIFAAQRVLQTGRLKIAGALPEAEALTTELKNYRVHITESGRDSYSNSTNSLDWRDPNAAHDDLVLALACALWLDQRPGVRYGRAVGIF